MDEAQLSNTLIAMKEHLAGSNRSMQDRLAFREVENC